MEWRLMSSKREVRVVMSAMVGVVVDCCSVGSL